MSVCDVGVLGSVQPPCSHTTLLLAQHLLGLHVALMGNLLNAFN